MKSQKNSRQELSKELKLTAPNERPLLVEIITRFTKSHSLATINPKELKQEDKGQKRLEVEKPQLAEDQKKKVLPSS